MLGRSLRVALVVGAALTVINQGDVLLRGPWTLTLLWKIPLTFCVPFCVATWGALSSCAIRHVPTDAMDRRPTPEG